MEKVFFMDWVFEVDKASTQAVYSLVEQGAAERLMVPNFQSYTKNREFIFPDEIIELFDQTGVDFGKEAGLYEAAEFDEVLIFGGWFHFVGRILQQPADATELTEEGKTTCKLYKIRPRFDVGFWEGRSNAYFAEHLPLVQMEFAIMLGLEVS